MLPFPLPAPLVALPAFLVSAPLLLHDEGVDDFDVPENLTWNYSERCGLLITEVLLPTRRMTTVEKSKGLQTIPPRRAILSLTHAVTHAAFPISILTFLISASNYSKHSSAIGIS